MAAAGSKRTTLVAAILGSAVVFLDGTVVNVALPAIREDLDTGLAAQQWIVEAYLLTLGALILVGGSLGDHLGRRRIFIAGLIGFGVTSALCAVAPTAEFLIAARALQGIAGALLVPSSLALVTATFPGDERGAAIGSWTAWTGMAFVIGPLGGGALIEFVSWRWIFAINVPLVLVTLAMARGVPESRDEEAPREIDYLGAVLASLGLAGPVFALIEQPIYGWSDPLVWVPGVAGLILLGVFLWHERRTAHPMLPLSLFRSRNFAVGNAATLLIYGGLGAATFFVTIYLQQVSGYSPIEAGLSLIPITLCMWFLSRRFGALSDRIGPRLLMGFGPIVAGLGLMWMGRLDADVDYWTELLPGWWSSGSGCRRRSPRSPTPCSAPCRSTTPASPAGSTTRSHASRRCSRSPPSGWWSPRASRRSPDRRRATPSRCRAGRRRSSTRPWRPIAPASGWRERSSSSAASCRSSGSSTRGGRKGRPVSCARSSARCGSRSRARRAAERAP